MDDQGFYCGYWRFALTIPKSDPMEFRLTGRRGNPRGAAAFRMKEYLEERFADAVAETLAGGGATALWLGGEWRYDGGVEADE
jgi:hypothetical protein